MQRREAASPAVASKAAAPKPPEALPGVLGLSLRGAGWAVSLVSCSSASRRSDWRSVQTVQFAACGGIRDCVLQRKGKGRILASRQCIKAHTRQAAVSTCATRVDQQGSRPVGSPLCVGSFGRAGVRGRGGGALAGARWHPSDILFRPGHACSPLSALPQSPNNRYSQSRTGLALTAIMRCTDAIKRRTMCRHAHSHRHERKNSDQQRRGAAAGRGGRCVGSPAARRTGGCRAARQPRMA